MRTLAFAIAGLLSLFIVLKPYVFWKIKNMFVSNNEEPTEDILKFIKIQGYIILVISIFGILFLS